MELGKLAFQKRSYVAFLKVYVVICSLDFVSVCDGKLDCKDASDESLCAKVQLNDGYTFLHSDPNKSKHDAKKIKINPQQSLIIS